MTPASRPLTEHFSVELTGLDLGSNLSVSEFVFVRQNFAESGVVLIRAQTQMNPADQVSFSAAFGTLENMS
jgi:alpha-ketoglutarate-dependent taurine dioxygenase